MPTIADLRRTIAKLEARIVKRNALNERDEKAIILWTKTIMALDERGLNERPPLRPLKERREAANVFTEYMTSAALRERNTKISRKKSTSALAEACRAAGLVSKNDLARRLGMSPGSLVAYEQGRVVPASVLRKIKSLTRSKLHPEGFAGFPNTEG